MTVLTPSSHAMEKLTTLCQEYREETASTEAFGEFVASKAPRLASLLGDVFRNLTTWDYARPEVINVGAVQGKLKKANYMDMDTFKFPVPVGFQGTYPDYMANLKDMQLPAITALDKAVLTPAMKLLASVVQDPIQLKEMARPVGWLTAKQKELKELGERESRFLQEGNRRDEMLFMELFENNEAAIQVMRDINEINTSRWRHANPKDISRQTEKMSALTQALTDEITRQQMVPDRQRMNQLIEVIEHVARWVEWFSVMSTRIQSATASLKTGEKKLMRAL